MSAKATSIVSYFTFIGWLIAYLVGDKEGAKFHLNQSLVLLICNIILNVIEILLRGSILGKLFSVVGLIMFILWIMGLIAAINQEEKEIPVLGAIKILK